MTRKTRKLVRFVKKVNSDIPRNGGGEMDDRAFSMLAKKVCEVEKKAMRRLAAN